VEAQVLQQDNLSILRLVDRLLNLLAHAVMREYHALAKQLLELGNYRLETVLRVCLSVGPAEVRHEDNGFGAVFDGILDRGEGADDALVVCDLVAV